MNYIPSDLLIKYCSIIRLIEAARNTHQIVLYANLDKDRQEIHNKIKAIAEEHECDMVKFTFELAQFVYEANS